MACPAALVFTPHGRNAEIALRLLEDAGLQGRVCETFETLLTGIDEDACFAIVTEEDLRRTDLAPLTETLDRQPPWSDFQFIVLTRRGGASEQHPSAALITEALRNVSLLERPFHPASFISLARTAARGRARQLEARARMEELKESEERLRTALAAGRLGAWEFDPEANVLSASPACKALFGFNADSPFEYQQLLGTVHPEDRERMQSAMRHSIEMGQDYVIEHRIVWPDRTVHWVSINARVVSDREGLRRKLVGVSADITDRRKSELELRKLNETLEARVVERTAELERAHAEVLAEIEQRQRTEALLRQSQKVELIGQLTGGVAHDFNNLLTAVIGNLDLLRKSVGDNPRALRLVDGAQKGAARGAALTQRLLAFARRQELQVEPRDLTDLIKGMADLIDRSLGPAIDKSITLPATVPPALMDVNQIELALLNLVVNARDAMADGGVVSIEVDVARPLGRVALPEADYVRLAVTDTGHGMDRETLIKATEPFFSTKELGKGTGLGLSMVHGLALQLGGALQLSSEVGHGTRAELWLPVAESPASGHKKSNDTPVPPSQPPCVRATILVVDDDPLISMSTADMIEDLGHYAIEANSGDEAIAILKENDAVDLLLTDYSMPRTNGAELASQVLKMRPGMPILVASGYAELPAGKEMNLPRIAKPFHQDQLAVQLQKLLAGQRD